MATVAEGTIAALAGVLVSSWVASLVEKRRHRWEVDQRWAERKHVLYLQVLGSSRQLMATLDRVVIHHVGLVRATDGDPDTWVALMSDATKQWDLESGDDVLRTVTTAPPESWSWHDQDSEEWQELEILGSDDVAVAAFAHYSDLAKLHLGLIELSDLLMRGMREKRLPEITYEECKRRIMRDLLRPCYASRQKIIEAVRADLLATERRPRPPEWPLVLRRRPRGVVAWVAAWPVVRVILRSLRGT